MNREIIAKIKISRELLTETKKVARQLSYSSVNEYIVDCLREFNRQWEKKTVELLMSLDEQPPESAEPLDIPLASPLDVFDDVDFESFQENIHYSEDKEKNQEESSDDRDIDFSDSEQEQEQETEAEAEAEQNTEETDPSLFVEEETGEPEKQSNTEELEKDQEEKEDSFELVIPEENKTEESVEEQDVEEAEAETPGEDEVPEESEKFVSSLLVDEWEANPPDSSGNILSIHSSQVYAVEINSSGQAMLLESAGGTGWAEPEEPFKGSADEVKAEASRRLNE